MRLQIIASVILASLLLLGSHTAEPAGARKISMPIVTYCLNPGFSGGTAMGAAVDLPAGWVVADIGTVRKPGAVSYDAAAKAFTIQSIGEVTEERGTFAFTRVKGDFVATCRVTAASQKSVGAGLIVRTSTNSDARFLKNSFNGFRFGNGPAVTVRQTDGVAAWQPGDITHVQRDITHVQTVPCWVRVIRHRDSMASYYSADGKEWNLMHFGGVRFSPGLPEEVFVGGFNAEHPRDRTDHGGSVGSMLSAFADVRASKGLSKRLWQRDLPYEAGTAGLGGEVNNFFCASYAGDGRGGYLFIGGLSERGVKKISIWALDPKTGEMAQRFLPGPEVAGYCGWFDFNNAINAMKRKDGEYILFAEDDGAQKVNMFRW